MKVQVLPGSPPSHEPHPSTLEAPPLILDPSERAELEQIGKELHARAGAIGSAEVAAPNVILVFGGAGRARGLVAAGALASQLRRDLYRVDLSMVVSKYLGETEKNLRRVFDAAEQGGAVLFFDEADALFGERTEIDESHDRSDNVDAKRLLDRMRSYRGLVIVATDTRQPRVIELLDGCLVVIFGESVTQGDEPVGPMVKANRDRLERRTRSG